MYINSIIHLKPISRISQVYFCFYKQNIVFQANVMFDGQNLEEKYQLPTLYCDSCGIVLLGQFFKF